MKSVTPYNGWNEAGTKCHISSVDMAASLLSCSTVHFGNGTSKDYGKDDTRLLDVIWIDEEQRGAVVDLPQLNAKDCKPAQRYTGAVFIIEGTDLRLRSRAYPGHKPEDFPEYFKDGKCIYPKGEMRLSLHDAFERKTIYERLMRTIRELREQHHV